LTLSQLAIRRPVTVLMIIFMLLLLGGVSITRLGLDLFPNISLPIAAVYTEYSGAAPEEVEKMVTRPLEETLGTVSRVKGLESQSLEGASFIMAEFDWGTNMDFATLEIREKVDMAEYFLPEGTKKPVVFKFDPSLMPILQLGMSGDYSLADLQEVAEEIIKPRLERLEGVASVDVFGGLERELQVVVDPSRMKGYGVTLEQIAQALRAQNLSLSGGEVEEGASRLLVRTTGDLESVEEIRSLPINTPKGLIELGDVARVEETYKERTEYSWMNGRPSIGLAIQKRTDANTVRVAADVFRTLHELKKELPGGLEIEPVMDQSKFINRSIRDVVRNAVVGGFLAMLILFFFLRNLRTTLIIGAAIPISIISTFILIYFSGLTLNMVSLGGLALGVGMLVDNAVVVLENIYRHREEGAERVQAAVEGSSEITNAITSSTLTTVAVFVPIIFVGGMAATMFRELALTVSFSLVTSLLVALTLIPMMSVRLLVVRDGGPRNILTRGFDTLYGLVDGFYRRVLDWALRHRKAVVGLVVLSIVLTVLVAPRIGSEFLPNMDTGQINIQVELPSGSSLAATEEVVKKVERVAQEIPEAETVFTSLGFTGSMAGEGGSGSEVGGVLIQLVEKEKRQHSTSEIVEELRQKVKGFAGAEIKVTEVGGFGSEMLSGPPVVVKIKGDEFPVLRSLSEKVAQEIRAVQGTREVETSLGEGQPEIQVRVDRKKAASYGLTVAQVAQGLRSAFEGMVATRYRIDGDEIDVRLLLPEGHREDLADLKGLSLAGPGGTRVELAEVAELVRTIGPNTIEREDQVRVVSVTAQLAGRDLGSVMADIRQRLSSIALPAGYQIEYGGQSSEMRESFADLGLAFLIAVCLVYMVMAAGFESLVDPLTIMFSVPLAIVGAAFGLFLTGRPFSVIAFLGTIMLVGIVVNNAIVLLDYINILRRRGLERIEAIKRAGPVRLRPILITMLTTVLGMLPLALGIGEGAEADAPLATVVIGGLLLSTVLTLVVVPVFYTIFEDIGARVGIRSRRKLASLNEGTSSGS